VSAAGRFTIGAAEQAEGRFVRQGSRFRERPVLDEAGR